MGFFFFGFPLFLLVYRNTRNTVDYMLTLYPRTVLNSLLVLRVFLYIPCDFLCKHSSQIRNNFISSSSIGLLIFFFCLNTQAKTFSMMLNSSSASRHPCLVPDLRRKVISSFTIKHDVGCRFLMSAFY